MNGKDTIMCTTDFHTQPEVKNKDSEMCGYHRYSMYYLVAMAMCLANQTPLFMSLSVSERARKGRIE